MQVFLVLLLGGLLSGMGVSTAWGMEKSTSGMDGLTQHSVVLSDEEAITEEHVVKAMQSSRNTENSPVLLHSEFKDPDQAMIHYNNFITQAEAALQRNDGAEAKQFYEQAKRIANFHEGNHTSGFAFKQVRDAQLGISQAETQQANTLIQQGHKALAQKNPETAIKFYSKAKQLATSNEIPDPLEGSQEQGLSKIAQQGMQQAKDQLAAHQAMDRGDYGVAIKHYSDAINNLRHMKQGGGEESQRLNEHLEVAQAGQKVQKLMEQGIAAHERGEWKKAEQNYETAKQLAEKSSLAEKSQFYEKAQSGLDQRLEKVKNQRNSRLKRTIAKAGLVIRRVLQSSKTGRSIGQSN